MVIFIVVETIFPSEKKIGKIIFGQIRFHRFISYSTVYGCMFIFITEDTIYFVFLKIKILYKKVIWMPTVSCIHILLS